ncbi:MAG: PhoH family protein [Candidatus Faecivicinus sp.]
METTEQIRTEHLQVESSDQFIGLFGIREENLPLFKDELGVELFTHSGEITITGAPEKVELAKLTLEKLTEILLRGETVDRTRIRYAIELAAEGKADRIGEIMRDVIAITYRGRQVKCKTLGQKQYVEAIKNNTCCFAVGPAGTGKTYLAIAMAVVAMKNKEIEKIILTRPAVEAGEKLGFLPGDLAQKVDPYLRPLYDALHEMLGVDAYQRLVERGAIEVAPLAYMRGRTLNDAFIILDEAQNTTSEQMKMFLTRMGMGSKMVITGDVTQIDLPLGKKSGLVEALEVLKNVDDIGIVRLSHRDVVRHELVQAIVRAYEKYTAKANERKGPAFRP